MAQHTCRVVFWMALIDFLQPLYLREVSSPACALATSCHLAKLSLSSSDCAAGGPACHTSIELTWKSQWAQRDSGSLFAMRQHKRDQHGVNVLCPGEEGYSTTEAPTLQYRQAVPQLAPIPDRRLRWKVPCLITTREADEKLSCGGHLATSLGWYRLRWNLAFMACVETARSPGCLSPTICRTSCVSVPSVKNKSASPFLGFHGGLLP